MRIPAWAIGRDSDTRAQIGAGMSQIMDPLRRQTRDSVFLLAAMRLPQQAEMLRIKVRNLSPGGMMAECPVHTQIGERVLVDLRNVGWVGGRVTWVVENRFGVAFDHEIDCKAIRQPVGAAYEVPIMCVRRPGAGAHDPLSHAEPGHHRI